MYDFQPMPEVERRGRQNLPQTSTHMTRISPAEHEGFDKTSSCSLVRACPVDSPFHFGRPKRVLRTDGILPEWYSMPRQFGRTYKQCDSPWHYGRPGRNDF